MLSITDRLDANSMINYIKKSCLNEKEKMKHWESEFSDRDNQIFLAPSPETTELTTNYSKSEIGKDESRKALAE